MPTGFTLRATYAALAALSVFGPLELLLVALVLLFAFTTFSSLNGPLEISLAADPGNPGKPGLGDTMRYHAVIRNDQPTAAHGIVAWLSLIQTDPSRPPVDVEDWSSCEAVTLANLPPGKSMETVWPIRLIQAGHYRLAVSASSDGSANPGVSPLVEFAVPEKPGLERAPVPRAADGVLLPVSPCRRS